VNSRQRVLTALAGGIPDRVPYLELYVDEFFAHRLLGLPPPQRPSPMSGETPVTAGYFGGQNYSPLELARALDLDGFCLSIQPQIYFDVRLSDGQNFVAGGKIHHLSDLEMAQLPDPDEETLYEPARRLLEQYRPEGYALGCFINLGSDPVILSMGWDAFCYALYDEPKVVHTLFDLYSDWFARAVRHINTLGFDFIWAGDDVAFKSGPMISPQLFRSLFLPYFRRVAEQIRLPWIFHTDGNFLPLLEDLLSLGMNALHPIEPEALDIAEVKRRLAGRAGLVGNIEINTLSTATPEEVEQLTRDTIRKIAPGRGYILSSSNSLTRSCRVENVLAMVRTCRECGRYPMD
jgi:hypothetical protein